MAMVKELLAIIVIIAIINVQPASTECCRDVRVTGIAGSLAYLNGDYAFHSGSAHSTVYTMGSYKIFWGWSTWRLYPMSGWGNVIHFSCTASCPDQCSQSWSVEYDLGVAGWVVEELVNVECAVDVVTTMLTSTVAETTPTTPEKHPSTTLKKTTPSTTRPPTTTGTKGTSATSASPTSTEPTTTTSRPRITTTTATTATKITNKCNSGDHQMASYYVVISVGFLWFAMKRIFL